MCEIQIIQKLGKDKIEKIDVGEFFKMMCFGSMNNNDAFGVFNNKATFKQSGRFDASKLSESKLIDSDFLIGHNRLSTGWSRMRNPVKKIKKKSSLPPISKSKGTITQPYASWDWSSTFSNNISNIFLPTFGWGRAYLDVREIYDGEAEPDFCDDSDRDRNHHPFTLGDFTLMHNGVITNAQSLCRRYNFRTSITTDSYVIIELINHFFKNSKIKDRIGRISKAIQQSCKALEGGYSVVLHDKKGNNTFYFKNMLTSFSLCKYGDKVLCGSTSSENLDYLYFGMKREKILIKSGRVYLITSNTSSPVVDVTLTIRKPAIPKTLYNILANEKDNINKLNKLDSFLEKSLGFLPLYQLTRNGDLKIATNNTHGIKEKIHKIVKKPRRRFGWYLIKVSDIKPIPKKRNKIKVYKMKGGKK